jgi:DNA-binding MarR family transcriptional regulator
MKPFDLVRNIHRLSRLIHQANTNNLEYLGINSSQGDLLCEVLAKPGISQTLLAQNLRLNKSVISRLISELERIGYIRRVVGPSSKAPRKIIPTATGITLKPLLERTLEDFHIQLLASLTPKQISELDLTLGLVTRNLKCPLEDSSERFLKEVRDGMWHLR